MNDAPLLVGRLEKVITSQQLVDLVSHIFTLRAFLIRSWISAITCGARGPGPGGASSVRLRCRRKSVEPPRSGSRMRQRAAGQNRVKVGPRTQPSVFRCSLKKAPVATRSALSAAAATARVEPTLSGDLVICVTRLRYLQLCYADCVVFVRQSVRFIRKTATNRLSFERRCEVLAGTLWTERKVGHPIIARSI